MSESKTRTFQEGRGSEPYRGHLIRKYLVSLAGVRFWRAEVCVLGLDGALPLFAAQMRTDGATLEEVVQAAKRAVGEMIFIGTGLPATQIDVKYLTKFPNPFDALVMVVNDKRAICPEHWHRIKGEAKSGAVNALIAQIRLTQVFANKVAETGILLQQKGKPGGYSMNQMLDTYAPICCWLGESTFNRILDEANPGVLLARARAAGVE